ncbi:MAG TPA: PAS domain S-box protein, partial [Candidatus Dormibacteraeota bacterium]|nr:PAS domain S-box protein [Candidatus Dormibacteraeota bacterium]
MTRLAVFGPGASELVDLLRALGYDATENVESKDEIDVVVIRGTEAAESITSALREVPSVLVAESIDTAAIECAARIGAIDIVLVGDDSHLRLAIEQAARHRPPSEGVAVSEDELLRHVVDLTPNYISVCDEVGRFVLVSQSLADFYGTTVEEIVGKTITGVASPIEAAAEMADHLQVLKTSHSKVSEREVTDRSGARRRLQLIKRPLALRDSSADLVLTVGIDVTRRYRTEAALENTAS